MNTPIALATTLALATATVGSAHAADNNTQLQRLATCQDSWLDWKNDAQRMKRLSDEIETRYTPADEGGAFTPKTPTTALGLNVAQVYPQSVGMGVGFSVLVNAGFAQARQSLEKQLGKPMQCSTSEGMTACSLALSAKKTAMLMTGENGKGKSSLIGCYYFYAQ